MFEGSYIADKRLIGLRRYWAKKKRGRGKSRWVHHKSGGKAKTFHVESQEGSKKFSTASKIKEDNSRETATDDDDDDDDNDNDVSEEAEETEVDSQDEEERESNASAEKMETLSQGGEQKKLLQLMSEQFNSADIHDESVIVASRRGNRTPRLTRKRKSDVLEGDKTSEVLASLPPPPSQISHIPTSGNIITNALKKIRKEGIESHVPTNVPPTMTRKMRSEIEKKNGKGLIDEKDSSEDTASVSEASEVESKSEETSSDKNIPKNRKKGRGREKTLSESNQDNDSGTESPGVIAKSKKLQSTADEDQHTESPKSSSPGVGRGRSRGRGSSESNISTPSPAGRGKGRGQISSKEDSGEKRGRGRPKLNLDRSDGSGSLTTSPVTAGRGRAKKIATVDDANSSHNSSLTSSPGAANLGRGKTKTVAGQVANQNSPSPSVAGVGRGRGKKPTPDDISSQRSSPVNVLQKKAKGKSSESETSIVDTSPGQQRRSTTPHERDPSPASETKRKRLSLSRDFGTEASQANKRGKQLTVPEVLKKQEVGSAVKSYPSRGKKEEQDIVSNVNTSVKSETVIKPETDVKAEETEPEDSLPDVEKEEVDMDVEINADANVKSDLFTKTGKKKKKHFKGLKYSFGNKKKKATAGVGRGRKPSGTTRLDTSQETDSVISEDIDIESLDSSSQDVPSEQLSQDPDALDELTSDAVDNDNEDGELENSMKTQAGEDVLDEDSLDEVSQEECGDEYADETVDDVAAEDVKDTEERSELANEDVGTQETKVEEKTALEADEVKKFDETENIKSIVEKEESVEGISGGNEVACIPSAENALKESFNKEQEDFKLETDTKKDYPPEVEADTYKDFPLEDEDESHTLAKAGIEEAAEENIVLEPSSEADLELRLDETLEGKKLEVDETELGKDLEDGENIEEEEEEIDPGTEMMEPDTSNFGSQSFEEMESAVSAEALTHTEDAEKPTMESGVIEKSFCNVSGAEHQDIDEGIKRSEEFVETGIEHGDNNEEMEKPEENFVDGSMLEQKDGNEEMKKPETSIDGENTESFHNVMNIPDPLKEAEEKSDKIEDQPSVSVSTGAPQGVIDASAADPSQATLENSEKIYEDECEEHPEKETTIENVPEESEKIGEELNDESVKEPLPLSEHNLRGSVRRRHSVSKRRLEDLGVEGQNSDSSDSVGETRVSSVEGVRKSKRLSRNSSPHPLAFAPPRSPDSAGNGSSKPIASKSSYVAEPTLTNVLCKCQGNENPIADGITGDVYCKAVDSFDGRMIGCCNVVTDHRYVRVSDKIPFMLICDIHRHRLRLHNCCPWCGLFCTQGVFNECRWDKNGVRHYYHKLCALVLAKSTLCPHCGSDQPPTEVQLELKMNRKPVIYLKQQQERKESSARMTWSKMEEEPAADPDKIPEDEPTFDLNGVVISAQRLPLGLHRQKVQEAIRSINSGKSFNIKPSGKGIYWACKQNDLEKLLYVLVNGVSPNMKVKEYGNQTGLHVAASYNSLAAVHVLILAGATLDMVDMQLMSPLMVAITKGHNEVVQYLVQAGASLMAKNQEGMTSLHLAAKCGNFVACQYIVDSGRLTRHSINTQDEGGWTPLVWASENRYINVVKYLVDHGGNPQLCDVEQNTALHWAAFSGSTQICSMLLDRGCSLRSMNAHGDTPLHIAARQNHTDAVVLFLSRGARLDVLNSKQQTPLECAVPESDVYLQLSLNSNLLNAMQQNNYRTEKILSSDIAAGKEEVPIPCVNGMDDDELPKDYLYIAENCEASNVSIDRTITSLKWCECEDGCNADTCSCGQLNFQCWFDPDGRLLSTFNYTDPPMIFECNRACRCNKLSCNNRVVQHGISAHMQLFKTDGKGWGVRALKTIQKGSYVCEYVGEIITDLEADQREDDSYLFDLDNKDSETFCIDARGYGNIARFINHLCEPNLTPVKVFIDHQDLTFPRIAFFANRDIEADEELGFDYGEKFWIIKYKHFTCTCGSEKCKYSSKTIYSTLENYNKRQLQSSKS
ncbi:dentin sialophosphoprotein-like isoform X2 [Macrobrachium nipponense]